MMWPFSRAGRRRSVCTRRRSWRPGLEQLETRLTPSLFALASFNGANGANPTGSLVRDAAGNLYGTTTGGGASNKGTVFEVAAGSNAITTLASFNGTNGSAPQCTLVLDAAGNLYGTTTGGGPGGSGTAFELAAGSGTITTLASFNGANGSSPHGTLAQDAAGNLYGATNRGGAGNEGTVFEVARGSGAVTVLASFPSGDNSPGQPQGGVMMDAAGNLYGTTFRGPGPSLNLEQGTIFELAHGSHTLTIVPLPPGTPPNAGRWPRGGLIMDAAGNLYGTAQSNGQTGNGTVFELAAGSSTPVALASFHGPDGAWPWCTPMMDAAGNLYGTTDIGGPQWANFVNGQGTVFEVAAGSGAVTMLGAFTGADGANPQGGVVADAAGNLYGAALNGGAYGYGTIYEYTASPYFVVTGPAGTTAGTAGTYTISALNPDGSPDTGYSGTVQITSSDPRAVLPGLLAISGGSGTFTATLETAGAQSFTATDTSVPAINGTDFGIQVSPAAASHFVVSGPSSVTTGTAFSVTVTATDPYGNTATGYAGKVHFTDSLSGATLPANYTFTTADAGVHTFTGLKLQTKGFQTITVADTTNGSIAGSLIIFGQTTSPYSFVVSGFPTTVTAGQTATITVTAMNKGAVYTGYSGTVHFTSSDPQAVLPADAKLTNGTATFNVTLKTAGQQSITASDSPNGIIGSETGITVNAGSATQLVLTGPATAAAGAYFAVTVLPEDAYGNIALAYTGSIEWISTDPEAKLPPPYTLDDPETFWVELATAGLQTITVHDPALGSRNLTVRVH